MFGNLFSSSVRFSHSNLNAGYLRSPRNVIVYTRKNSQRSPFHRNWSPKKSSTQQLPHAEISGIYCAYMLSKRPCFRRYRDDPDDTQSPPRREPAPHRRLESQTFCAVRRWSQFVLSGTTSDQTMAVLVDNDDERRRCHTELIPHGNCARTTANSVISQATNIYILITIHSTTPGVNILRIKLASINNKIR